MILKIIAAFLILIPLNVTSKPTQLKTSTLTIYSDNHERFVLVLDGKEQYRYTKNDVKLTGLNKHAYKVKIIFQNKSLPIILADVRVTTPSGAIADAYYNIRRTPDGSVQLHSLSFVPINDKYLSNDVRYFVQKPRYEDEFINYNEPVETKQITNSVGHNRHNATAATSNKSLDMPPRQEEDQYANENSLYASSVNLFRTGEEERKIKPIAINMAALGSRKTVEQDGHADYINVQNSLLTEQQLDNLSRVRDEENGQNANVQMVATVNGSASDMQMTNTTDGGLAIVTTTQPSVTVTKSQAVQGVAITPQATTYTQPGIANAVTNDHPDITAMDVPSFDAAKLDISELHNVANKLSIIIMLEKNHWFSSDQVYELCMLFTTEQPKLIVAKTAFSKTIDPVSYYKINNAFQDNASIKELRDFLEGIK